MQFSSPFSALLGLIPTLIKLGIMGVAIFMVYYFINEKRKGVKTNSNIMENHSIYVKIFGVYLKKRIINNVFLVLGALPLLIYPMVLLANVMSLAALPMSFNIINTILAIIVVLFTSAYLPIYILCFKYNLNNKDKTVKITSIPLIYLSLLLLLIF